jgi:catechol 2,3-dioxygenase-like lactoylglutathione lyase family enzyme
MEYREFGSTNAGVSVVGQGTWYIETGGPKDAPALWLYADKGATGPGVHVAFRAADRAAVDRFHKQDLKAGGRDNGSPGLRADHSLSYYAAYLIDPDGNNVEAVCLM